MLESSGHLLVSCHWPDSLRKRSTKCCLCIIDQTSFRTKGTVVVFGLNKLYTKECTVCTIYILLIQTVSHPRIGQIEGEVREMEQVWAKVSDHVSYALFCQKSMTTSTCYSKDTFSLISIFSVLCSLTMRPVGEGGRWAGCYKHDLLTRPDL